MPKASLYSIWLCAGLLAAASASPLPQRTWIVRRDIPDENASASAEVADTPKEVHEIYFDFHGIYPNSF